MKGSKVRDLIFVVVFMAFLASSHDSSAETAAPGAKPFWTEKSSFIEGEWVYLVGVASGAPTREKGREKAFEAAKSELMNFLQLSDVSGLVLETQMTYEEVGSAGAFNAYRLLRAPLAAATELQERRRKDADEQVGKLRAAQAEMEAKQKALEAALEKSKSTIADLEEKQRQLQWEIEKKEVLLPQLTRDEARLKTLDDEISRIHTRLSRLTKKAEETVRCGMTLSEVKSILGNPGVSTVVKSTTVNTGTKLRVA